MGRKETIALSPERAEEELARVVAERTDALLEDKKRLETRQRIVADRLRRSPEKPEFRQLEAETKTDLEGIKKRLESLDALGPDAAERN